MKNHISFIYQNIHSFRSKQQSIHIDAIVEIIKSKDIYLYCVQETRLEGDYAKEIENYTMFNHYLKGKGVVEDKMELQYSYHQRS